MDLSPVSLHVSRGEEADPTYAARASDLHRLSNMWGKVLIRSGGRNAQGRVSSHRGRAARHVLSRRTDRDYARDVRGRRGTGSRCNTGGIVRAAIRLFRDSSGFKRSRCAVHSG